MEPTISLKHTENALRGIIEFVMRKAIGDDWIYNCGVDDEVIKKWFVRAEEDQHRLGTMDQRLLFYADFYTIKTLILRNWDRGFADVFGKKKRVEVLLDLMESFRNPDAHRRELLPYHIELVNGIDGWIRTHISRYYMSEENAVSYYAKIDSVATSIGATWSVGQPIQQKLAIKVRVGSRVDVTVTATDPQNRPLNFHCVLLVPGAVVEKQSPNGKFSFEVESKHVYNDAILSVGAESDGEYHPKIMHGTTQKVDDQISFIFDILPPLSAG